MDWNLLYLMYHLSSTSNLSTKHQVNIAYLNLYNGDIHSPIDSREMKLKILTSSCTQPPTSIKRGLILNKVNID